MSYANHDEIRGVLVQCGQDRLLLPNALIAEVVARVPVTPVAAAPAWLLGRIAWQGWDVPLVAFGRFTGRDPEPLAGPNKVVVLKGLRDDPDLPYLALLTESFPQLISVPRDGLLADAAEEALPPGVQMRVLLGEQTALLPDLDTLEAAVAAAQADLSAASVASPAA